MLPAARATTKLCSSQLPFPPAPQLPASSSPSIQPAVATVDRPHRLNPNDTPRTPQRLCQGGGREITPSAQVVRL